MSNLYDWNGNKYGPPECPHHHDDHCRPVPPPPPYMPPHGHDSYSHDGYHEYHGHPYPHEYPTHGPMLGSGFYLLNYNPFLVDTTHVKYGNFINVAENVNTRISRRRDDSCINLDATFNLTGQIIRNAVMQQHLEQSIANHFDTLEGFLPIVKSDITFRLYFTVQDDMGGVVHQSVCTVTTPQMNFHFTDIRDYFVTSMKSIFVANIPAMDYTGMYRLILEKIEVFGDVIDTKEHVTNDMNPFYQFVDNNNKIIIQHDTIQNEAPDHSILLASVQLHEAVSFQANITTRLRISFVAFLSELIAVPHTYGIWNAMFAPTDEKIDKALREIATLKESIYLLTNKVTEMSQSMTDLSSAVDQNAADIAELKITCNNLQTQITNNKTDVQAILDDHEYRIRTLEQRPLALNRYHTDTDYVRSQLIYQVYGQLYQAAKDFKSTTFDEDVANGNLVPLTIEGSEIIDALSDKVDAITVDLTNVSNKVDKTDADLAELTIRVDDVEDILTYVVTESDTLIGTLG